MITPGIGSIWSYKRKPLRLYRVVCVTNIAHLSVNHPPQVVYETRDKPDRKWSRGLKAFYNDFAPVRTAENNDVNICKAA